MKIDSPIANLIEVLQQVNQTAVKYGSKLKTNEAATRAALIDPILKALGWDISNLDMVELERAYGDTRLDYGLLDLNGKVNIIVEAKALGVNLSDPKITTKLFAYGFTYAIQNIILTDGIIWQHYLQVSPGNMTPDCIDISKDDFVTCADFFISKVDAYRFRTATVSQTAPIQHPKVTNLITPILTSTTPSTGFTPLNTLPSDLHGKQPPKSMRLPDETIVPIHYWRDILVKCVKFVMNENTTIPIPLPDKAGKKVSLLSEVKPPSGVSSIQVTYNGKIIYVHINYDVNNCVANALYINGFLPKSKLWQPVAVSF